jgi:DNA-binding SARP family transcriptional activator
VLTSSDIGVDVVVGGTRFTRRAQPRDRLVGLCWGDRSERKARRCLSTALWRIRRCLPDDGLILSDPHTVQFDPQCDLWLDAATFESQARHDDIGSLRSAVSCWLAFLLNGMPAITGEPPN